MSIFILFLFWAFTQQVSKREDLKTWPMMNVHEKDISVLLWFDDDQAIEQMNRFYGPPGNDQKIAYKD